MEISHADCFADGVYLWHLEIVDRMSQYFQNIAQAISTLFGGLKVTWKHFLEARNSRSPIGVEDKDYFEQKEGIV